MGVCCVRSVAFHLGAHLIKPKSVFHPNTAFIWILKIVWMFFVSYLPNLFLESYFRQSEQSFHCGTCNDSRVAIIICKFTTSITFYRVANDNFCWVIFSKWYDHLSFTFNGNAFSYYITIIERKTIRRFEICKWGSSLLLYYFL